VSRSNASVPVGVPARHSRSRWLQLFAGIVCMVAIANLQYGWTLFVQPMSDKQGWARPEIQAAFTIFVLAETWLVPLEGWVVDRFGPKLVIAFGGVLVGLAWTVNSFADSLFLLYLGAALGGIGAGAVFGTCLGNALKWFPDRRGLAVGLTTAGFGMGSLFTIIPIQDVIATRGYQTAFLWFGLGQGIAVFVMAWLLRSPTKSDSGILHTLPVHVRQSVRDVAPLEMLRSPVFWVLYAMFVLVAAGGLMATAQLAPISSDFKVADVPVSLLGLTLPALTFALMIDRVLNGITRPFCGWVSDHIGREATMFIAFSLEAAGIWALWVYGHDPLLFVLLGGMVFFAWGEIASLFPATCADCFGTKYATTNAGLLYTAKGTASMLVPLASLVVIETGSWRDVFLAAAFMNVIAAVLAIAVLRPMRSAQDRPRPEPAATTP
jgi:OFA family oxalate/formate antiporter-like MFS transporter